MNTIKILIFVFFIGFLFSCDENDPILVPDDIAYVSFVKSSANYTENDTTLEVELQLVTYSKERVECSISFSIEGLDNPAIEGADVSFSNNTIVFENGIGYVKTSFTLSDNDKADGKKQFYIELTAAPAGFDLGIDGKEKILITIIDDEHPLKYFSGEYAHLGNSPATWSGTVNWTSQIEVNPDDDTQIIFNNIFPWRQNVQVGVLATINEAEKTIVLASAQRLTETGEGKYYFRFYSGENFNDNWEGDQTTDPILGTYTINTEKTEIVITLNEWGAKWIEPDGGFDGRWWNDYFYSSVLTKSLK